jgi:RNA polymerase sigma-70 factor (ECF subfamily)
MDEGPPCGESKILGGAVWTGAGERHGPNPVPIRTGAGDEYMVRKPNESQDEDRSLLQRVARGDQVAFAVLYDRYGASCFGMALKICNNRALAEDVVQEAFLSIWQRAGRFDSERGSVAAYLFAAVHNKAVDAVRHEESLRRREEGVADFATETEGEEVVEAAWLGVRRKEVRSAVARLSPVQREALELAYFEGLTYSEVADKLGIPLGTAKTRLRDGMIRLRGLLPHLQPGEP